jgi:hypothetical protein
MSLVVKSAVYGALPGGNPDAAQAFNVTKSLQTLINDNAGVVAINNTSIGDPSPDNVKHFGAVVNRNGQNFFFACQEGQSIDFNHGGGVHRTGNLTVKAAVYGALPGGDPSAAQASDVSGILQAFFNMEITTVAIDNNSFGDPSFGNQKNFMAVVDRGGRDLDFACREGQFINFEKGGG